MYKRLWRLLTGLVAIACGIAFGLLAGMGLVRADQPPGEARSQVVCSEGVASATPSASAGRSDR